MADSLLSSGFLEDNPRRERFRQAKQRLLHARGELTLDADSLRHLAVPDGPISVSADSRFMLTDGRCIYPLKLGTNTIGRFSSNDIVLDSKHASRRHCVILVHTNGTCELHDTASLNGTYLNGTRVRDPRSIYSGDQVQCADQQLLFLSADEYHVRRRTRLANDTQLG